MKLYKILLNKASGYRGNIYSFDGKDFYWFEYGEPNKIDYTKSMDMWLSTTMTIIYWND